MMRQGQADMFSEFKKDKERTSPENIAIKVIPLIFLIPILYLFLFVGRIEALTAVGVSLSLLYVVYIGTQLFLKARRKSKEAQERESPHSST